jgi:crotonobetainyl-CoA:carnitine CoA-transferase CaiB-like acyl-CoA transferase
MIAAMEGIRVLEVAEHTFVPAASGILADWGADVIKIEHAVRGDAMRGLASTGVMNLGDNTVHVLNEHANRGKRSLGLDLSTQEGVDILYKLAATADVFLTNKLPHVRTKLAIDVDDIRAHNPDIVYVRGSGFGSKGPDADQGGYDGLAYWARSGLAMGGTTREREPIQLQGMPGPAYGDSIGAMTIAGGICAALLHRALTGETSEVDISLLSAGLWAFGSGVALSLQLDTPWRHVPAVNPQLRNPLSRAYLTSDGRWIVISCLQGFHYWPDWCRVIDRLDLVDDERFDTVEHLSEHAYDAALIIETIFADATLDEWRERLADFSGQWAVAQTTLELPDDPMIQANGYIQEAETKDGVTFPLVATPVQFGGEPSPAKRAPEFNEHGDDILTNDLGLDWDTVIDLKLKGVVA